MPATMFANFEDWRTGSFGWLMRGAQNPRAEDGDGRDVAAVAEGERVSPRGAHFDPRNFTSLGPRVSVEVGGKSELTRLKSAFFPPSIVLDMLGNKKNAHIATYFYGHKNAHLQKAISPSYVLLAS